MLRAACALLVGVLALAAWAAWRFVRRRAVLRVRGLSFRGVAELTFALVHDQPVCDYLSHRYDRDCIDARHRNANIAALAVLLHAGPLASDNVTHGLRRLVRTCLFAVRVEDVRWRFGWLWTSLEVGRVSACVVPRPGRPIVVRTRADDAVLSATLAVGPAVAGAVRRGLHALKSSVDVRVHCASVLATQFPPGIEPDAWTSVEACAHGLRLGRGGNALVEVGSVRAWETHVREPTGALIVRRMLLDAPDVALVVSAEGTGIELGVAVGHVCVDLYPTALLLLNSLGAPISADGALDIRFDDTLARPVPAADAPADGRAQTGSGISHLLASLQVEGVELITRLPRCVEGADTERFEAIRVRAGPLAVHARVDLPAIVGPAVPVLVLGAVRDVSIHAEASKVFGERTLTKVARLLAANPALFPDLCGRVEPPLIHAERIDLATCWPSGDQSKNAINPKVPGGERLGVPACAPHDVSGPEPELSVDDDRARRWIGRVLDNSPVWIASARNVPTTLGEAYVSRAADDLVEGRDCAVCGAATGGECAHANVCPSDAQPCPLYDAQPCHPSDAQPCPSSDAQPCPPSDAQPCHPSDAQPGHPFSTQPCPPFNAPPETGTFHEEAAVERDFDAYMDSRAHGVRGWPCVSPLRPPLASSDGAARALLDRNPLRAAAAFRPFSRPNTLAARIDAVAFDVPFEYPLSDLVDALKYHVKTAGLVGEGVKAALRLRRESSDCEDAPRTPALFAALPWRLAVRATRARFSVGDDPFETALSATFRAKCAVSERLVRLERLFWARVASEDASGGGGRRGGTATALGAASGNPRRISCDAALQARYARLHGRMLGVYREAHASIARTGVPPVLGIEAADVSFSTQWDPSYVRADAVSPGRALGMTRLLNAIDGDASFSDTEVARLEILLGGLLELRARTLCVRMRDYPMPLAALADAHVLGLAFLVEEASYAASMAETDVHAFTPPGLRWNVASVDAAGVARVSRSICATKAYHALHVRVPHTARLRRAFRPRRVNVTRRLVDASPAVSVFDGEGGNVPVSVSDENSNLSNGSTSVNGKISNLSNGRASVNGGNRGFEPMMGIVDGKESADGWYVGGREGPLMGTFRGAPLPAPFDREAGVLAGFAMQYEAALQMVDRAFDLFSKPSEEASPPLPIWDKLRWILHGTASSASICTPLRAVFAACRDPWTLDECLVTDFAAGLDVALDGAAARLTLPSSVVALSSRAHLGLFTWLHERVGAAAFGCATSPWASSRTDADARSGVVLLRMPRVECVARAAITARGGGPPVLHSAVRVRAMTRRAAAADTTTDSFAAFRTAAMGVVVEIRSEPSTGAQAMDVVDSGVGLSESAQSSPNTDGPAWRASVENLVATPSLRPAPVGAFAWLALQHHRETEMWFVRMFGGIVAPPVRPGASALFAVPTLPKVAQQRIGTVLNDVSLHVAFDGVLSVRVLQYYDGRSFGGALLRALGRSRVWLQWRRPTSGAPSASPGAAWTLHLSRVDFGETLLALVTPSASASASGSLAADTEDLRLDADEARACGVGTGASAHRLLEAPRLFYVAVDLAALRHDPVSFALQQSAVHTHVADVEAAVDTLSAALRLIDPSTDEGAGDYRAVKREIGVLLEQATFLRGCLANRPAVIYGATDPLPVQSPVNGTLPTAVNETLPTNVDETLPTNVNETISTTVNQTLPTTVDETVPTTVNQTIPTTAKETVNMTVDESQSDSDFLPISQHYAILQDARLLWHQGLRDASYALADNSMHFHRLMQALRASTLSCLEDSTHGTAALQAALAAGGSSANGPNANGPNANGASANRSGGRSPMSPGASGTANALLQTLLGQTGGPFEAGFEDDTQVDGALADSLAGVADPADIPAAYKGSALRLTQHVHVSLNAPEMILFDAEGDGGALVVSAAAATMKLGKLSAARPAGERIKVALRHARLYVGAAADVLQWHAEGMRAEDMCALADAHGYARGGLRRSAKLAGLHSIAERLDACIVWDLPLPVDPAAAVPASNSPPVAVAHGSSFTGNSNLSGSGNGQSTGTGNIPHSGTGNPNLSGTGNPNLSGTGNGQPTGTENPKMSGTGNPKMSGTASAVPSAPMSPRGGAHPAPFGGKGTRVRVVSASGVTLRTTSAEYAVLYGVIVNLLVYSDASLAARTDRVASLRALANISDARRLAHAVSAMQRGMRRTYARMARACARSQRGADDSVSGGGPGGKEQESLQDALRAAQERWDDLALVTDAVVSSAAAAKLAGERRTRLALDVSLARIQWSLLDDATGAALCDLALQDVHDALVAAEDGSQSNAVEIGALVGTNLMPAAFYSALVAPLPAATLERLAPRTAIAGAAVRANVRMLPAVGGIRIMEQLEVVIAPLQIQLTHDVAAALMVFFFPAEASADAGPSVDERRGVDERRAASADTLARSRSSSVLAAENRASLERRGSLGDVTEGAARPPQGRPLTASLIAQPSGAPQSREWIAERMLERARTSCAFIYVYVPSSTHVLSFKGRAGASRLMDLHGAPITLPDFEYHSRLWSWRELAGALLRDSVGAIANNVGSIVREKIRGIGGAPTAQAGVIIAPGTGATADDDAADASDRKARMLLGKAYRPAPK